MAPCNQGATRWILCAAENRALYDKGGGMPQGAGGLFTVVSYFRALRAGFAWTW
jgi:hypothetical protein